MNIISPLQAIQQPSKPAPQQGQQQGQAKPQQGQLLKALVVEARTDKTFLLNIGDNKLLARSEAALRPGQTLQLQLTSTAPEIQLKIVGETLSPYIGRSLTLVGNTLDIKTLFSSLQQPANLLGTLSSGSRQTLENYSTLLNTPLAADNSGSALKQLIDRMGLSFENMLARGDAKTAATTLKSALLEILTNLNKTEQASVNASKTLSTLEFFQLAQMHTDSSQQFLFPLPFSFLQQGYLLINRDQSNDGQDTDYRNQEYRFALHVKLTHIGSLRIDFLHSREGLSLRIQAETEEKAEFLKEYDDMLKTMLSDTPIRSLLFTSGAEEPAAELVRLIVPEGTTVLDTTA